MNQFHITLCMAKIWLIGWNGENKSKIIAEWMNHMFTQLIPDCFLSYIYRVLSGWRYLVKVCEGSLTRKSCGFSKFLLAHPHHLNPLLLSHCHVEQIFLKLTRIWRQKIPETQRRKEQPVVPTSQKKKIWLTKKHGETPQAHPSSFISLFPVPSTSVRPGLDTVTYSQTWRILFPRCFFRGFSLAPFPVGFRLK